MRALRAISTSGAMLGALSASFGLVLAQPVQAQSLRSDEHQVVVSAVVPDRRTMVVDASGQILMLTSNTPKDVTPEVRFLTEQGPKVALTPTLTARYQLLLSQVRDNNPVFVMTRATRQLSDVVPQFLSTTQATSYFVAPVAAGQHTSTTAYAVGLPDDASPFTTVAAASSANTGPQLAGIGF